MQPRLDEVNYRLEDEMLASLRLSPEGKSVIDYEHYSFWKDLEMIVATVLGRKIVYAGEEI